MSVVNLFLRAMQLGHILHWITGNIQLQNDNALGFVRGTVEEYEDQAGPLSARSGSVALLDDGPELSTYHRSVLEHAQGLGISLEELELLRSWICIQSPEQLVQSLVHAREPKIKQPDPLVLSVLTGRDAENDALMFGNLDAQYSDTLVFDRSFWNYYFSDRSGKMLFESDDTKRTFMELIRTGPVDRAIVKDVWLRVLNLRPWGMCNETFSVYSERLEAAYKYLLECQELSIEALHQIDVDVPRSQLVDQQQFSALKRLLVAFVCLHKQHGYVQGYSYIAANCIKAFTEDNDIVVTGPEHLIFAVFNLLMTRHMLSSFANDFDEIRNELSQALMDTLSQQDPRLFNFLSSTEYDQDNIGVMFLPQLLLWLSHTLTDTDSTSCLLSTWTFFLAFPKPKYAVVCMLAAMLMEVRTEILELPSGVPIFYPLKTRSSWPWDRLKQQCIVMYADMRL